MAREIAAPRPAGVGEQLLWDELLVTHREEIRLRQNLEQLSEANRGLSAQLVDATRRIGALSGLVTAMRRLLDSRDPAAALAGVEEVLVDLLGAEDFVIYTFADQQLPARPLGGKGPSLAGARQFGPDPVLAAAMRDRWRIVRTGDPSAADDGSRVVACVPLTLDDRVVGGIVIHSLLPHRDTLSSGDQTILDVLGRYAAPFLLRTERPDPLPAPGSPSAPPLD